MFPAPATSATASPQTLPLASLVHYGSMREPGLILVSRSGELRLWESIGVGLSGAEGFATTQLPLLPDEEVLGVHHCDVSSLAFCANHAHPRLQHLLHLATTSAGRLFRLAISASGHVVATPFRSPPPVSNSTTQGRSRIWSRIFSSGPSLHRIVALSLGPKSRSRGTQEVWVMTEDALLRYHVSVDGSEQVQPDFPR